MTTYELPNGVGYRAPAEDRVYTPPAGPQPFTPPPVTASAANAAGTTPLEQAHAAMVHARNSFEKHVKTTNESRHLYSNEGFHDQVAGFKNTAAAAAVDKAVENLKARRDQAQADADKVRRSLTQPGDAAQESRNTRYWARAKPLLDKTDNVITAARDLIADASREELSVLLEELPPYLASRNTPIDWIDGEIRRLVPEYGSAKSKLEKANAAVQFTEQSARYLKQGFDSGVVPSADLLERLNPHTVGRLPIDRRGTLTPDNGGRYDPDK